MAEKNGQDAGLSCLGCFCIAFGIGGGALVALATLLVGKPAPATVDKAILYGVVTAILGLVPGVVLIVRGLRRPKSLSPGA